MNLRITLPAVLAVAGLAACGSNANTAADAAPEVDAAPPDASDMVTFSYTPSWAGVRAVDVVGAFGLAGDWTTPLVSLTESAGTYTGTAQLAAGSHAYLFHVTGDADAGAQATTIARYVLDPASAMSIACPAESPTYSATVANPCGVVTAGQAAVTRLHVHGRAVKDGAPVAGYLVLIEREEASSHHFFVDRVTTGADGSYDLQVAPGMYRLQIQHPQFEAKTDAQLAPDTLGVARRLISSAFAVSAAVSVADAEVADHDYGLFAPRTTGKLTQTFTFAAAASPATRLDVYGTAKAGVGNEIGDPWYVGAPTQTGSATFDGTFTTAQKGEPAVVLGERYFWGVERKTAADSAGVSWTVQSMVYPITFN